MVQKKKNALTLFGLGVIPIPVRAGIWANSTARAHSETAKQNIEGRHRPNEIAGVTGFFVLVAAGVIASIPRRGTPDKS
jgi:hypothetical protein